MKVALSPREVKRLWAVAGNQCAFPGCSQALVQGAVIVGEQCHILGENPGSARYTASASDETVNAPENRILMCPTHHTIIDDPSEAETTYAAEVLRSWKALQTAKGTAAPSLSAAQLDAVAERFGAPSSVTQVAIQSPGAIQVAGDFHNHAPPKPRLVVVRFEGADGDGNFGKKATIYFAAEPMGPIYNAAFELTTEGLIRGMPTAGTRGSGMVVDTTNRPRALSNGNRTFTWGQSVLQAGHLMFAELEGDDDLGRIRFTIV